MIVLKVALSLGWVWWVYRTMRLQIRHHDSILAVATLAAFILAVISVWTP